MTTANEKMMPMENHCKMPMERIAMESVGNYLRCVVCKNTVCWGELPGVTRHYCFRHQRPMFGHLDYPQMVRPGVPDSGYAWGCSACDCDRYTGMSAGVCISFPDADKSKKKWWQFWK